jgi:FkbM family methyltransferase
MSLAALYRRYLRAADHPAKLRVVRLLERCVPSDGLLFETHHGLKLHLHPRDATEREVLLTDDYEPHTISFLQANVQPGDTAVCAGVSFGLHLMLASRAAGATGYAVGVEPQPSSLLRAAQNIQANTLPDNIRLVCGGIGEAPGLLPIGASPVENRGFSSFVTRPKARFDFHVFLETLPVILQRLGLSTVHFMILDVEGYELNVMQSFSREWKPQMLVVEMHPWVLSHLKIAPESFYERLWELGYKTFDMHGGEARPGAEILEHNIVALAEGARIPKWLNAVSTR